MSLLDRQYVPNVISLILTSARTAEAQGLTSKINTITFLTLDGGSLTFRLNSATADLITASDGMKIEGIPITEIYWTHTAQAGLTAEIFTAWID